jgi:hypothetical protein
MVILHSKKIIFVHIAKNAGMWVTSALWTHAQPGDFRLSGPDCEYCGQPLRTRAANVQRALYRRLGRSQLVKHSSAQEIRDADPALWESSKTFAVLRDPVERFLSMMRYAMTTKALPADPLVRKTFLAIRRSGDVESFVLGDGLTDALTLRFFMPQWRYISDPGGAIIINHLVPIERLAEDMGTMIQISPSLRKTVVNASAGESVSRELSGAALERLHEAYREDYEKLL